MKPELPLHLAAKLTPEMPAPKWKEWADAQGTPWTVYFPKRGQTPAKRRFFAESDAAVDEVLKWWNDRKPDAVLGRRVVDEVHWAQSVLPPGVTLRDAVRFYLEHNAASASKMTLKEITDLLEADLKRMKKSPAYLKTIGYAASTMNTELGKDTLVAHLTKAVLVRYIRGGGSYWDRFGRKRIVSLACSKAVELEIFKRTPLEGFTFEKEPKKSVHALTNGDAQAILDYFYEKYPQYLPAVAIQLFAGLRTEELCREAKNGKRPLAWSDITFGKIIDVPAEVAKTHEPREIEFWSEALTNWLMPFRKAAGPILNVPEDIAADKFDFASIKSNIIAELNAERKTAGLAPVDFRKNDFRHTFASNCVAFHKAYGIAQLCLGHTNGKTIKRYRTHRDEESAKAYFSSRPVTDNVVAISA